MLLLSILGQHPIRGCQRLSTALQVDMFITLIVVMVSQVYAYFQTYQMVYIKYMKFLDISYTSIRLLKK